MYAPPEIYKPKDHVQMCKLSRNSSSLIDGS